jgi:hypothetical protein
LEANFGISSKATTDEAAPFTQNQQIQIFDSALKSCNRLNSSGVNKLKFKINSKKRVVLEKFGPLRAKMGDMLSDAVLKTGFLAVT